MVRFHYTHCHVITTDLLCESPSESQSCAIYLYCYYKYILCMHDIIIMINQVRTSKLGHIMAMALVLHAVKLLTMQSQYSTTVIKLMDKQMST